MEEHRVRVHPSADRLPREEQLAWKIAAVAAQTREVDADVLAMIAYRVVDNAGVALAAINRRPVAAARAMALAHPRAGGARLFGLAAPTRVDAEWAAWANATAVRELDFHDTFLAADYAHPGDSIQPLVAVAEQTRRGGADLARGIAVAYEIHVALVKALSLHQFKKDHVAHLAPATTAGIGALLGLPTPVIFQAVNQAVHLAFSTRQSRKGEISSWKAFVPGFSGKLAIDAVDRAMRGEAAPSPIYEGEDSVIAWMLGGPATEYTVALPLPGEPPRAILETYTKAHSAEYQAQALIDLAIELAPRISDFEAIEEIVVETSNHTHVVIGTGSNDPQKFDPEASRETLDHSIMYILAVTLEDRRWHHEASYAPERARRPSTVALWRKIRTVEDPVWTERYHEPDPAKRAFGGRISVRMQGGGVVAGEKAAADAHPNGARPWGWDDYVGKFNALTAEMLPAGKREAFLAAAQRVAELQPSEMSALVPALPAGSVIPDRPTGEGIFDYALPAFPAGRDREGESRAPIAREDEALTDEINRKFRERLARRDAMLLPGAANALAARIIEDLGFEAVYLSGAGLTNTYLGLPDLGFVSLAEIAAHTSAIRDAVALPIVVDADTGFGNALNVRHTIRTLERAGASAVQIEDQVNPKRCGHFSGKDVIAAGEMVGKVKAAVDARHDESLLVIARTDARATLGFEAAIERAAAYIEAGADVTFVEAPESVGEIRKIPSRLGAPQLVNMVVGGRTPIMHHAELQDMGFALVLYANAALQGAVYGMQRALSQLKMDGRLDGSAPVASFRERQRLVQKELFDELEERYAGKE